MARKSKYALPREPVQNAVWRPALYLRLSREDGDKVESDSIANQRSLLSEYAANAEDLAEPEYYLDDGYSGTNFDRPGFQTLLADLRAGKVNCVIVKDLSRLGRNYIDVGEYLERVFPLLGVRFISVNDRVDSYLDPQSMNNLIVPFKNIINDEYCRDISNKVRASLDLKRRQGKFIGSFASYGYRKDPGNHNRLLIDEEAADVVRSIFGWFLSGVSVLGIARRLNEQGIPNPSAYKRLQGMNYHHPAAEKLDGLWPDSSVRRILKNRLYTGTMVQGKNRVKSYKLPVSERLPEGDWIAVEATHEAIIPPETFEAAQALFARDTRTPPQTDRVYLFSGFLRCADCGRAMHRKQISQPYRQYGYYICSTFKKQSRGSCTKHTIRSDRLEQAVLTTVQQQIALAVEMDELLASIRAKGVPARSAERLLREREQLLAQQQKLERMKLALYPDWKNGDLSRDEYHALKGQFEGRLAALAQRLAALEEQREDAGSGAGRLHSLLAQFTQYRNLQSLSREVLAALVDFIEVQEGGGIKIHFKFANAFSAALDDLRAQSGGESA